MMSTAQLAVREKIGFGREMRKEFLFEGGWRNLNHGSFGTYPRAIQTVLRDFQAQSEARPDDFILYQYPHLLDAARESIAKLLHAPSETIVFVPNASTGINVVLRNLVFEPGDKILYTSTIYGACQKAIQYITETTPAEAVRVEFTHPIEDEWLVAQFRKTMEEERRAGNAVRIAVFDTIASVPGVRLPFERLVAVCRELGVLSLIDGAHGVGHVGLDLGELDPDFFVSNCHKWLLVPRGAAVFYVPTRNQPLIRSTLPTSHGFIPLSQTPNSKIASPLPPIGIKSAWVANFEFVGTIDSSPYLCIPAAIAWRESIGGEAAIISYCTSLARAAGKRTAEIFGTEYMDNSTGTAAECCLSNVRLPLVFEHVVGVVRAKGLGVAEEDVGLAVKLWMNREVIERFDASVMVVFYGGQWWVRWSAMVYLELGDFEWGAEVLKGLCGRVLEGGFVGDKKGKESKL